MRVQIKTLLIFELIAKRWMVEKIRLHAYRLTTVTCTPVPCNSCWSDSENPSIANFEPQYAANPGIPKLAANDATFIMCPFFSLALNLGMLWYNKSFQSNLFLLLIPIPLLRDRLLFLIFQFLHYLPIYQQYHKLKVLL